VAEAVGPKKGGRDDSGIATMEGGLANGRRSVGVRGGSVEKGCVWGGKNKSGRRAVRARLKRGCVQLGKKKGSRRCSGEIAGQTDRGGSQRDLAGENSWGITKRGETGSDGETSTLGLDRRERDVRCLIFYNRSGGVPWMRNSMGGGRGLGKKTKRNWSLQGPWSGRKRRLWNL